MMGFRSCRRFSQVVRNVSQPFSTTEEKWSATLAIPLELAASLARDARRVPQNWLSLVHDYPRFASKVDHLERRVGVSKREIVEDMTLLSVEESAPAHVPPRVMAKRELLSPFGSQVEYCAELFKTSVDEVYLAAAFDPNVLTPKYPTRQWRCFLRDRNLVPSELDRSTKEEERAIEDVVSAFAKVGVGGEKLIRRIELFDHPTEDVADAVELVRDLYETETFGSYHLVEVFALLRMGRLSTTGGFGGRSKNASSTVGASSSYEAQAKNRRLLLELGFSRGAISECPRVLRFSEEQIESGFLSMGNFEVADRSDLGKQLKLINLLQYYIEKEGGRSTGARRRKPAF